MIIEVNTIIDLVLSFVVGLLFGLAVKKGLIAFILALAGFFIASYIGLTFVPKVSILYEINRAISLLSEYVKNFQIGTIALSLTVVLFALGIVVGLWKG